MAMQPIDYAQLSDHSYRDLKPGRRAPGEEERIVMEGIEYKILEHRTSESGYQGTIYQRTDTSEIVVAHRGTEQIFEDGVIADGGMALQRFNLQSKDAIALTQSAINIVAERQARGENAVSISTTGHSLGGLLAQQTAHDFGIRGQTFNAYGAAELGLRIPEGGNSVINHVMATDPVSAAARHYGDLRMYATPEEIATLSRSGFSNSRYNAVLPDAPLLAAAQSLGSHQMANFLGPDSVLRDPAAQQLSQANERMIQEYRSDVYGLRAALTASSRGPIGNLIDLSNRIRESVPAGDPARRESVQPDNKTTSYRIDQEGHRFYPLFSQAQLGVHQLDRQAGRQPDRFSDYLAGSLAAEMGIAGGKRIDAVMLSDDGKNAFAVQGDRNNPAHLRVCVDTRCAINTPLESSTQRLEMEMSANDRSIQQEVQQQAAGRAL